MVEHWEDYEPHIENFPDKKLEKDGNNTIIHNWKQYTTDNRSPWFIVVLFWTCLNIWSLYIDGLIIIFAHFEELVGSQHMNIIEKYNE